MTFNYSESFDKDNEKWIEFDLYLNKLSGIYKEEFENNIYKTQSFLGVGYKAYPPDIICTFHDKVPVEIQEQIKNKLKELFP